MKVAYYDITGKHLIMSFVSKEDSNTVPIPYMKPKHQRYKKPSSSYNIFISNRISQTK